MPASDHVAATPAAAGAAPARFPATVLLIAMLATATRSPSAVSVASVRNFAVRYGHRPVPCVNTERSVPAPYAVESRGGGRVLCLSGTPWEGLAGFSRATRQGSRVHVSGTTATHGRLAIGGTDAAAQTHFAIDKIAGALQSLGARLEDVVRTRVFVRRLDDWEPVARAHGERFGHIQPANTLVSAGLVGDEYLVEVEAEAEVSG